MLCKEKIMKYIKNAEELFSSVVHDRFQIKSITT